MEQMKFFLSPLHLLPVQTWNNPVGPKEKFLTGNVQNIADEELLSIMLGNGQNRQAAMDMAKRLLHYFDGNLMDLGRCSPKELVRKFNGIGENRALNILAGMELGRRSLSAPVTPGTVIHSSVNAFHVLCNDLSAYPYEKFLILLVARSGRLIRKVAISEGGTAATTVDVKKVFKYAIDEHASGIVLAHNHPSGNLEPSKEDIRVTEKLLDGARLLDLHIFDHLIICGKSYFSFADNGLVLGASAA